MPVSIPESALRRAFFFVLVSLRPEYFFLACNFLIFFFSDHFKADRPVLVIEYLLVVMLWGLRFLRSAVLLFAAAFIFDIYLVVYQIYPFEGLTQLVTLISFLKHANTFLLIQVLSLLFLLSVGVASLWCTRSENQLFLLPIFIATVGSVFYLHTEKPLRTISWKKNAVGFSSSVLAAGYYKRFEILYGEMKINKVEPAVSSFQASNQMRSEVKTFFIMLESLGAFSDEVLNSILMEKLEAKSKGRRLIGGTFGFSGSTVNAELRELCGVTAESHMLFTETRLVEECLPSLFNSSIAIHGADSDMYDRRRFYPKLGFDVTKFESNNGWKSKCYSFPGVCDLEVIKWMDAESGYITSFDFIYYLTLNSHYPYDIRDISESYLKSSHCEDFELEEQVCRYFLLQKQTIDAIASLLDNSDYDSYRVIVVGDHPPVITNLDIKETYFKAQTVPYMVLSAVGAD